jgi:hypothetical protein
MEDISSLAAALRSASARCSASPSKQHRLVSGRTTLSCIALARAASHSARVYGKRALTLIAEMLPAKEVSTDNKDFSSWTSSLRRFRLVSRAFRRVAEDVLKRRVRAKYPRLGIEKHSPAEVLRFVYHIGYNKFLASTCPWSIVLNDNNWHNSKILNLYDGRWRDQQMPEPDLYRMAPGEQIIRHCRRDCIRRETDTDVRRGRSCRGRHFEAIRHTAATLET